MVTVQSLMKAKTPELLRVRYNYFHADVQIRKRIKDYFRDLCRSEYYHYSSKFKNNTDRILQAPLGTPGKDSASIYSNKNYFGIKGKNGHQLSEQRSVPIKGYHLAY